MGLAASIKLRYLHLSVAGILARKWRYQLLPVHLRNVVLGEQVHFSFLKKKKKEGKYCIISNAFVRYDSLLHMNV